MAYPIRLRLSRAKGFNLQSLSVAINGLPAVIVARPRIWGNPFTAEAALDAGYVQHRESCGEFLTQCFREWATDRGACRWWQGGDSEKRWKAIEESLPFLRGKNLACWCKPDAPCHADVLLELANRPVCEEVQP